MTWTLTQKSQTESKKYYFQLAPQNGCTQIKLNWQILPRPANWAISKVAWQEPVGRQYFLQWSIY
jgi:hypothetical protein